MRARSGLVLLAHGARDPRWAEPLERVRDRITVLAPDIAVELAFLEHLEPDLGAAARRLADAGCSIVTVVPAFLGQGGHVRRDVPERIAALRREIPGVEVRAVGAAGDDATVIDAIAAYCLRAIRG